MSMQPILFAEYQSHLAPLHYPSQGLFSLHVLIYTFWKITLTQLNVPASGVHSSVRACMSVCMHVYVFCSVLAKTRLHTGLLVEFEAKWISISPMSAPFTVTA